MRQLVSLIVLFTAFQAPIGHAERWLVLGDSISAGYGFELEQGWVNLLRERLKENGEHEVINASISGETTGGALARLPNLLSQKPADWIIIELGGNDGLRGYPINSIRDNLNNMIELAQAEGTKVILVSMQIPPNYGPRYTRQFRAVYDQLNETHELIQVEIFLETVATDPELMQSDGIHPKAEAQSELLRNIWPAIETALLLPEERAGE
ncbi:arylesterase [Umboniibacter marinipuniceus]|uniref:Acyl-CoA thioesterase-1 n=1 Tax=Umboniibacter marinipuniceus TaxID=569599 RepID=A0A3M0A5Q4_9GAMM|nr:arylesterase [Umboniibacter marinipuniceus]RMA78839.1 acyl-CoA thioesterase-1 [Umboniibacter marinipuniceus]